MRRAKLAMVLAVVVMLLAAHQLGILHRFGDPAELRRTLIELGAWGYVAFIVAFALLQPFGLPGTVFVWAAALIWPWQIAYPLSMVGTMAASVVGFSFARFVARDFVASKVPPRFKRFEDALERRAFATVFVLRLVFWMPPLLHAFFGISKLRFSTHFWGSLAGYALPLLLISYFGDELFSAALAAPVELWAGLGAGAALLVAAVWLHRRTSRA